MSLSTRPDGPRSLNLLLSLPLLSLRVYARACVRVSLWPFFFLFKKSRFGRPSLSFRTISADANDAFLSSTDDQITVRVKHSSLREPPSVGRSRTHNMIQKPRIHTKKRFVKPHGVIDRRTRDAACPERFSVRHQRRGQKIVVRTKRKETLMQLRIIGKSSCGSKPQMSFGILRVWITWVDKVDVTAFDRLRR